MKQHLLPDKPSALIRLALQDLERVEKDPRYEVSMEDVWHEPYGMGICRVCLAGAVMAMELGAGRGIRYSPADVVEDGDKDTENKLHALDCFRTGCVEEALAEMGIDEQFDVSDRTIEDYHFKSDQFKADMLELANELEVAGW